MDGWVEGLNITCRKQGGVAEIGGEKKRKKKEKKEKKEKRR